jgi:endonuclease G
MTAKKKKKPRKRGAPAASLPSQLRRLGIWCLATATIAIQTTSCGFAPATAPSHPRTGHAGPSATSASTAAHFRDCPQFFAGGVAPVVSPVPHLRELCYDAFAILHSGSTRTPVFVAERLNRRVVQQAQGESRTDRFFADARLPRSERAELADYKGSGYARGHMAPAGDMPTPAAMAQSFSLANMVPQDPKQNSGPWAKIEQDTRRYAMRAQGDVYVITGPVFGLDRHTIGADQVRVPTHLFKLVYDATTKRAWAHWQQNAPHTQVGKPISYGDLKQRIGMELLPGVEVR